MKEPKGLVERIGKLGFVQPPEPQSRVNPFSGKGHKLVPLAVMLYDFITTRRFVCGRDYSRQDWDNARYWFQSQWPDEYMDLLD